MPRIMLVKILKDGEDARIGRRARPRRPLEQVGEAWGYLETIFQYSDGTEVWRVTAIGHAINLTTSSSRFELLPGPKKAVTQRRSRDPGPKHLSEREILRLLLEALDLKHEYFATSDEKRQGKIVMAIHAIQVYLVQGENEGNRIGEEYVYLLQHWNTNQGQREGLARATAQLIARLMEL